MPRRTASRSTQSSYGLSEWASFGTVGQLAGFRERLFGAGVPIVKGGLVFPLTYHGGDLFWRSHILQQLADVGRAQGILTVAIDASIFATRDSLQKQELHGLVAFRADRVFALRHLHHRGQEHFPSAMAPSVFPKSRPVNK